MYRYILCFRTLSSDRREKSTRSVNAINNGSDPGVSGTERTSLFSGARFSPALAIKLSQSDYPEIFQSDKPDRPE